MSNYRRRISMYSIRQEQVNNTARHRRRMNGMNENFYEALAGWRWEQNESPHQLLTSDEGPELYSSDDEGPQLLTPENVQGPPQFASEVQGGVVEYHDFKVDVPVSLHILITNSRLDVWCDVTEYKFKEPKCFICLSDFKNFDIVRVLDCDHKYCNGCIDRWLSTCHTCPVCKFDLNYRSVVQQSSGHPYNWGIESEAEEVD
ncbi:hypothetical protein SAGO17_0056 [Mimivirus AB-566-O17]|uniref:RING-type domain-containing protein n=1 Tax=Mimivirus AB-566-O17 TaxID=1988039 RepID=A0A1X9VNR7_9VIRU|nr:hypothetical protein SAGO17_0056 [Mimivirus AB-566-O17]